MDASSTISATYLHAITFLLSPLGRHYPPQTLDSLHLHLLSSFNHHLDISHQVQVLLLSATAPPPECIRHALDQLNPSVVHWEDWALLLGAGNRLVLSLIAGAVQVAVRDVRTGQVDTRLIWSAAIQARNRAPSPWATHSSALALAGLSSSSEEESSSSIAGSSRSSSPSLAVEAAENVLNDDGDDEILFSSRPPRASPYCAPVMPVPVSAAPRSLTPSHTGGKLNATAAEWHPGMPASMGMHRKTPSFSTSSLFVGAVGAAKMAPVGSHRRSPTNGGSAGGLHSRSSSRSSTLSNSTAPSLISSYSSASSASLSSQMANMTIRAASVSTLPATTLPPSPTLSEEGAETTVYLDPSKDQGAVTEYECGKVGVLTGAVMLGVGKGAKSVRVGKPGVVRRV